MLKGCVLTLGLLLVSAAPCLAQLTDDYVVTSSDDSLNLQNYRAWVRLEYLLWHLQAAPLPTALVTSGGLFGLGAVGAPDTTILYGGSQDYGWLSGSRLAAGLWFDCDDRIGVEGSFFMFGARSEYANFAAPAGSVLSLPFFSAGNGPSVISLAVPGNIPPTQGGSVSLENDVRFLGGNLDFVFVPFRCRCFEFQVLAGFASVYLKEDLAQNASSTMTAVSSIAGSTTTTTVNSQTRDSFGTQNIFYGGDIGVRGILRFSPFFLEATTRLAVGTNYQIVDIAGQSSNTVTNVSVGASPGTTSNTVNANTGFLAQASNVGNYSRNTLCLLPQTQLRVGMDVTDNIRLSVGYDILYLSTVVRPGNQIDQLIGSVNGTNHPVFPFNTSSFFAHGMNAGLEFRF